LSDLYKNFDNFVIYYKNSTDKDYKKIISGVILRYILEICLLDYEDKSVDKIKKKNETFLLYVVDDLNNNKDIAYFKILGDFIEEISKKYISDIIRNKYKDFEIIYGKTNPIESNLSKMDENVKNMKRKIDEISKKRVVKKKN